MGYDGTTHKLNRILTPEPHEKHFMKRVVAIGHPAGYTIKWRDRSRTENDLVDVHYVVLEGNHSDTELLEPFNYLKSLGELDNNSITVENNLVEEGTYVPELQNNILPTYPEVTHVTWGEDVVIPPEVEIELKNGEEVIQTITQLPVKLETTGEEKLHVKTMKGKTLVNWCTYGTKLVELSKNYRMFNLISSNSPPLQQNKDYLLIIDILTLKTPVTTLGLRLQIANSYLTVSTKPGLTKYKFNTGDNQNLNGDNLRLYITPEDAEHESFQCSFKNNDY